MADSRITVLTNHPNPLKTGSISNEIKKDFDVINHVEYLKTPELYNYKIEALVMNPYYEQSVIEENLNNFPNLKVVHAPSTGTDHVLKFIAKGIRVSHTPVYTNTVADAAIGIIITSSRLMSYGKEGLYTATHQLSEFHGHELYGSTLGIYGLGNIGFGVAKRAALGFNVKILYNNTKRRSVADEESIHATYCSSLDEMLPQVDHVVITAPLTPQTHHAFGARQFELMKNTATIVNVGRGSVIDTEALVAALQKGQIHAAGLDVTDPEPLPDGHPLWSMPNVYIYPHAAFSSEQCLQKAYQVTIENILAGVAGKPMPNEVFLKS